MWTPRRINTAGLLFTPLEYAKLWQYCKQKQLKVVADVHTHGGPDVRQSSLDQRHPMVPVVGHTAMIAPYFGHTGWWSLAAVGVYEYLGNFNWRTHQSSARPRRIKLSLW